MRQGKVYYKNRLAGIITETNDGEYVFTYDDAYTKAYPNDFITFTMPVRDKPYTEKRLFPFFEGLIPEGWLLDIAFLDTSDIAYYSWDDETIVLTKNGKQKLRALEKKIHGEPFVIKVNNKRIFAAWFWFQYSSVAPFRVYTIVRENSDKLKLYPPLCGKDPRNNEEFLSELVK